MSERTVPGAGSRLSRLQRLATAEFLKIQASRVPLAFALAIPVLVYAFVFELYHVERVGDRMHVRNAVDVLGLLYFASSKTLMFPAAVLAFAAYWASVDSQYGMIRVACAQPIARLEYLVGKWCGIAMHVAALAAVLVGCLLGWTVLYSGVSDTRPADWWAVARFTCEVVSYALALAVVGMAVGSSRRTVGAALVTAIMAMVALALMTMLPFDLVPPRLVFIRHFFFPLGEFNNPWPHQDSPFVRLYTTLDFVVAVVGTPLLVAVPAAFLFARRDITE